jgi:hypothetical protein
MIVYQIIFLSLLLVEFLPSFKGKGKGKAFPFQAHGAHRVLGRLRLPDSVISHLVVGCQPYASAVFTPSSILVLIFNRLSRPREHRIVGCHGKKSPVTPPGIDLGTFQIVL